MASTAEECLVGLWVGPSSAPDRYELIRRHSRGGEGELWEAVLHLGTVPIRVAVKIGHGGLDEGEGFGLHQATPRMMTESADTSADGSGAGRSGGTASVQRWEQQTELLRTLDHPNLVRVREVFLGGPPHERGMVAGTDELLYLVMNWIDGRTAAQWVVDDPGRGVVEVLRVMARVADAVDYLHGGAVTGGVAVLHRDIKPANIILDGDRPRLVDFGLARLLEAQTLTVAGTPAYLAPEVIAGEPFTTATDRFALGATAYHLLTGDSPRLYSPSVMRERLAGIDEVADPDGFAQLVLAMVDPVAERRPSRCVDWVQQLTLAAVTGPGGSSGGWSPSVAAEATLGVRGDRVPEVASDASGSSSSVAAENHGSEPRGPDADRDETTPATQARPRRRDGSFVGSGEARERTSPASGGDEVGRVVPDGDGDESETVVRIGHDSMQSHDRAPERQVADSPSSRETSGTAGVSGQVDGAAGSGRGPRLEVVASVVLLVLVAAVAVRWALVDREEGQVSETASAEDRVDQDPGTAPVDNPVDPGAVTAPADDPQDEARTARLEVVSAGTQHTCGLDVDGGVVCWGSDDWGQSSPPAGVRLVSVSAGGEHSCGVDEDTGVACWGRNSWGQSSPPAGARLVSVSTGARHSCGVDEDGGVVCWGSDDWGQASPPAGVRLVSVSAGGSHSCGVDEDGGVVCWGWDTQGQSSPPSLG